MNFSRQKDKRLILEGLPVSHYVEKVRWCLDKLEVPFENEDDAGILGIFMLGRFVSYKLIITIVLYIINF